MRTCFDAEVIERLVMSHGKIQILLNAFSTFIFSCCVVDFTSPCPHCPFPANASSLFATHWCCVWTSAISHSYLLSPSSFLRPWINLQTPLKPLVLGTSLAMFHHFSTDASHSTSLIPSKHLPMLLSMGFLTHVSQRILFSVLGKLRLKARLHATLPPAPYCFRKQHNTPGGNMPFCSHTMVECCSPRIWGVLPRVLAAFPCQAP